ncbi:hypothetical protein ACFOHT_05120 [Massilia oculi]|uniref:hypothetical protein n=1 Tax=Massilia oculi TaxID=945844 RepID=UPI001E5D11C6|nr:hypothetical protein [Massilia oculi]
MPATSRACADCTGSRAGAEVPDTASNSVPPTAVPTPSTPSARAFGRRHQARGVSQAQAHKVSTKATA